ncbi:MAG: leucine-rich repeat domain-containing protein [Syntrophobacterales bacterium]|nr:leucine-rich repeat domain-containing protein [Syntrophobacterales bacterium]
MKKKSILGTILFCLLIAVLAACSQKYDAQEDFQVRIISDNKAVRITSYLGIKEAVRIPPRIKRLPVTAIGSQAFMDRHLTSVIIPDSVTVIESKAFTNNKLRSVAIPKSVTSIGKSAFSNNQLTDVTIPDSVTYIGGRAFAKNQLTVITIGANVRLGDGDVVWDYYWRRYVPVNAFGNFDRFYKDKGSRAGTYNYDGSRWHLQ